MGGFDGFGFVWKLAVVECEGLIIFVDIDRQGCKLDSLGGGECAVGYSGVCADGRIKVVGSDVWVRQCCAVGRMNFVGGDVWVCHGVGTCGARGVEVWDRVEGGIKLK